MNLHFLVKNPSTVCPCFILMSVIISYIFLSNYNIKSQKKKWTIMAAYLDMTTLETKLCEKEGEAGR